MTRNTEDKAMARKKHTNTGPHVAGCACGPCHNARTAELRTKAPKISGPHPCPATDSDPAGLVRGRPCVFAAGHDGPHSTDRVRLFVDAPPPAEPKAKKPKGAKAAPVATGCNAHRNNTWHAPATCRLLAGHEGNHEAEVTVAEDWPEAGEVRRIAWDIHGNGVGNEILTPAPAPSEVAAAIAEGHTAFSFVDPSSLPPVATDPALRIGFDHDEPAALQTGRASGLKHPPDRLFGYRRHAAGALWAFADLDGEDLDRMAVNLQERDRAAKEAHGDDSQALINSIVLVEVENESGELEKFVLDGWNRARACEAAGVKPRFMTYGGDTGIETLLAYVDAVNDKRRHTTPSQRAAVAAGAARLSQGNSSARKEGTAKTQAERAKEKGISDRLLRRAEKVMDNVTPKMWETVQRGKVSIDAALNAIDLPAAKQDELADRALSGNGEMRPGKFRAIARQEAKRDVVQRINREIVAPMPMGPFGLIVADYPWLYENSDNHEGSRGHMPYPGMGPAKILAHAAEAGKRAADDAVLGIWTTGAFLRFAFDVIEAFGFVPMDAHMIWDKVHVGMGIQGLRHQHEYLLLATRGKPTHTLNELSTVYREARETGHSKKPDGVYALLAKHCAGPRLELFAIGEREGWQCWGAESEQPIATPRKSKIMTASDARAQGHA